MDYLRKKQKAKIEKIVSTSITNNNNLILNIINQFNQELEVFKLTYINVLPDDLKKLLNEKYDTIINLISSLDNDSNEGNNIKTICKNIKLELIHLGNILETNKLNYKQEVNELQTKLNTIQSSIKYLGVNNNSEKETIKLNLDKEETIYKNEKQRITNKINEYKNKLNQELLQYQSKQVILMNKIYDYEAHNTELNIENSKFEEINKLHRRDIVNQVVEINSTKKHNKKRIDDTRKKLNETNDKLNDLNIFIQEYPSYKLNINTEYYYNILKLAYLLHNLLYLNLDEILESNVINKLFELVNNEEYKDIFNILLGTDIEKDINIIKSRLSDYIEKENNGNNILEIMNPMFVILGDNIENYFNYIEVNILEPYKGDYLKNKNYDLMMDRRKKEKRLLRLRKNKIALETNLKKANTSVGIKNNFLVNTRLEISKLRTKLKENNKCILTLQEEAKGVEKEISRLSNMINNNIIPENLISDTQRCERRITLVKKRTQDKLLEQDKDYRLKLGAFILNEKETIEQLEKYKTIENGFNLDFLSKLKNVIVILNNEFN